MKTSDNITELAKALVAAQSELKNPRNASDNPYFQSKYAELPDVLNLVRPVLTKHGLSIVQSPITDESNNPGVASLLLHSSGQFVLFDPFYMRPTKTDPQAAGGAITYARRYSLNAILALCGEDEDDDGNGASAPTMPQSPPAPILCPICGKVVKPIQGRDGTVSTPEQVLEKLGNMCLACYRAKKTATEKAERETANTSEIEEEMVI